MDRRHFTMLAATGLTGLHLRLPAWLKPLPSQVPEVDGLRLNQRMRSLARFGANAAGGIDRVAFGDSNIEALDWVAGLLAEAGFSPSIDFAGNLIARKPGSRPELLPIMLGSHIDSVPGGGNYDGQVGSMGALEVATSLADAAYTTRHPLEILIFSNEEGGKTGSRALAGEVQVFELDIVTASGFTIADGLRRLGGNPDRLAEVRRADEEAEAFLELHIEQGAVLDADEIHIGVVEGIVGIMRWNVIVDGKTNHAGTTPMDRRADAMVGAARFVDLVHTTARRMPGQQVATVGRLEAEPGVPNVIPGRVTMTLEIRDLSMAGIERVYDEINRNLVRVMDQTETRFSFQRFYTSRAAPTAPWIREIIETSARGLGLSTRRMPSGAGHDAQSIALFAPVGMIFVPSVAGVSHAPDEHTTPQDIINGTNVLLRTLLELDER
ncbi:MAG TPA: Zn-dependent hydrolase [Gemmatimonadetes bacterium]|nr:Zn-dependent hydrolase [Gemmatimonadota bacterium]